MTDTLYLEEGFLADMQGRRTRIVSRVYTKDTNRRMTAYKKRHRDAGTYCCEVCDWRPPMLISSSTTTNRRGLGVLAVHHILPRSYGGSDADENLILLCPNHHGVAHGIAGLWLSASGLYSINRCKLITALLLADTFPDDWVLRFDIESERQRPLPRAPKAKASPRPKLPKAPPYEMCKGKAILYPKGNAQRLSFAKMMRSPLPAISAKATRGPVWAIEWRGRTTRDVGIEYEQQPGIRMARDTFENRYPMREIVSVSRAEEPSA